MRNDRDDYVLHNGALGRRDGSTCGESAAGKKREMVEDRPRGAADFLVQGRESHGVDGLVNMLGIESPGLTASLAIAEHVVEVLEKE